MRKLFVIGIGAGNPEHVTIQAVGQHVDAQADDLAARGRPDLVAEAAAENPTLSRGLLSRPS